jgi:parvulin-like peptidyl-prolyl isomerase
MRRPFLLLLPSLALALPAGAEIVERVIVKVNGEILTQTEFQARQLAAAQAARIEPERVGAFLRENNAKILEEAIDDLLLVQRAQDTGLRLPPEALDRVIADIRKENGIDTDERFQEALRREGMTVDDLKKSVERNILRRQILNRELESKVSVTESEARKEYDAKLATDYTRPATVTLHEIYLKNGTKAEAEAIVARLRAGEDFAAVARQHSAAASKANGGQIGTVAHGELHPDIEKVAFALAVGAVSDPIRSGDGYRILKVADKADRSVVPFEEARDTIRQRIAQDRWGKQYADYMKGLRANAIIDLRVREVPLQLAGAVTGQGGLLDAGRAVDAPVEDAAGAPAAAAAPGPPAPAADPNAEFVTSPQSQPEVVTPPSGPEPRREAPPSR